MKYKLNVIQQPKVVTIYLKNKKSGISQTLTFSDTHANFNRAKDWVANVLKTKLFHEEGKVSQESFEEIQGLSSIYKALTKWSNSELVITRSTATYKGKAIPQEIADFLVSAFLKNPTDDNSFEAWAKYVEALQNPNISYKVANRLFKFLQKNDLTITSEGKVLAWKVVREDYKDKHSGKFDNSPGQVLEMDRSKVNDNDNDYCSYGFHVCSWDYLKSFAGNGNPVMQVEVDIMDIISIPLDYNGEKVRVCKYKVLKEVGKWGEDVSATRLPDTVGYASTV